MRPIPPNRAPEYTVKRMKRQSRTVYRARADEAFIEKEYTFALPTSLGSVSNSVEIEKDVKTD
jgi:hypothetical protein